MVEFAIKSWDGQEGGSASLDLRVADEAVAAHIVHRALVRQMSNARQGTVSTKTRAEVRGGGRKPWRQKGTGRARAGSNRSPLWRGGGVTFGPKPRDYSVKMNRKERRLALRTALLSRAEDMVLVEAFEDRFERPKTRDFIDALGRWGVDLNGKVLVIVAEKQELVYLSVRNIENVKLITANGLNVYDLLAADQLVITSPALELIQEVYSD
ncbi:MAG: 50S ribosomal protein L4 [Cyanobacteriota bacterium]|jgi:large subunit ribosomal protein L4|nr:50S ribosomal protein L4 [Cyanobacteriota bacterium]